MGLVRVHFGFFQVTHSWKLEEKLEKLSVDNQGQGLGLIVTGASFGFLDCQWRWLAV